jgi:hypothetical protein
MALLNYVRTLIPIGAAVFLVGDCKFDSVELLKWLDQWHWFYVLRQKSDTCLWLEQSSEWKPFGSFIRKAGQIIWLGKGYLTAKNFSPTKLLIHWQVGEEEAWCLATNLPDQVMALHYYRRRMWCEELHGDLKDHGFDLESTMLHDFLKLSRLTLVVVFLHVWLISVGSTTIHNGLRHLVDRNERHDMSIFQMACSSYKEG